MNIRKLRPKKFAKYWTLARTRRQGFSDWLGKLALPTLEPINLGVEQACALCLIPRQYLTQNRQAYQQSYQIFPISIHF
jgi:hypothetical protein